MAKEFKSTNELIEILNSKGVSIKDENNIRYLIEKYSYYSIVNSYKWIFKIGENYKDNASFEEIFAMYKFDKNLKIIMLKYILEIEAVIKTKIANLFAEKYGLEDYLNTNNFDLKDDNSNLEHIEKLIEEIKSEIDKGNGKHDAITHYISKYGFVPPWVVTKILSLGTISKFYGLMKQQDRQEISKQFHINDRILKNILGNLTSVRNIAAHDDRLYTYRSTFYIRLDKTKKSPDKALHTNMYIIIKSLELLLENDQAIEMKSLITKELDTLKDNLTSITIDEVLKVMGFDKDYYILESTNSSNYTANSLGVSSAIKMKYDNDKGKYYIHVGDIRFIYDILQFPYLT